MIKIGQFWKPLGHIWHQKSVKDTKSRLPKIHQKNTSPKVPPGLQNDPKMTSKWVEFFWQTVVLGGSGWQLPPKWPPEHQNHKKIQKKHQAGRVRGRNHFWNICFSDTFFMKMGEVISVLNSTCSLLSCICRLWGGAAMTRRGRLQYIMWYVICNVILYIYIICECDFTWMWGY